VGDRLGSGLRLGTGESVGLQKEGSGVGAGVGTGVGAIVGCCQKSLTEGCVGAGVGVGADVGASVGVGATVGAGVEVGGGVLQKSVLASAKPAGSPNPSSKPAIRVSAAYRLKLLPFVCMLKILQSRLHLAGVTA
jgi:hypothetical protein